MKHWRGWVGMAVMVSIGLVGMLALAEVSTLLQRDAALQTQVASQYGQLPLSFVENVGQTDQQVAFTVRSAGGGDILFYSAGSRISFTLPGRTVRGAHPL